MNIPTLDREAFAEGEVTLLTYRHVWTERDRDGDMQYQYYCTWSDGSEGLVPSLRWDRLQGAVELPMDSVRARQQSEAA